MPRLHLRGSLESRVPHFRFGSTSTESTRASNHFYTLHVLKWQKSHSLPQLKALQFIFSLRDSTQAARSSPSYKLLINCSADRQVAHRWNRPRSSTIKDQAMSRRGWEKLREKGTPSRPKSHLGVWTRVTITIGNKATVEFLKELYST